MSREDAFPPSDIFVDFYCCFGFIFVGFLAKNILIVIRMIFQKLKKNLYYRDFSDDFWVKNYVTIKNAEWIVFAWEDSSKALKDKQEYYAKN